MSRKNPSRNYAGRDIDDDSAQAAAAAAAPSLQSMAARFQDRANQVAREQNLLHYEQQVLHDLEKKEREQKDLLDKDRRNFLHVRLDRDTAEEIVLSYQEKITKLRKEIVRLQEDMTESRSFNVNRDNDGNDNQLHLEFFGKKEPIIPSHRRRRVLYMEYLKGCIDQVSQAEQTQQNKRKAVQVAIGKLQEKRKALNDQTDSVQTQTGEKQREIVQLTSQSHILADKVRVTLTQRTQLREDIRQARE